MAHPGKTTDLLIDGSQSFQTIDGFGVNINSKYWGHGKLTPTLELLLDDLGATLYRVDIWGKSDWADPTGTLGPGSLNPAHLDAIYKGEIFQQGWELMRWLNDHGLQPYLAASGDVPRWMLAADGKTLEDFPAFARLMASLVEWARKEEQIDFRLFGPLNETDLGSPEGPTLGPLGFCKACEGLVQELDARRLNDIQLVVPEQSSFNTDYIRELVKSKALAGRIGAFGLHDYSDLPPEAYAKVCQVVNDSRMADIPLWMTEYGDLEQTGEQEWVVAWAMTSRLFDQLEAGFRAALVWDAFDNYHDHDDAWTIYGLLRAGLRVYTPKKRYYATKQVYRFVRPGFVRIYAASEPPDVRVLAFSDPRRTQVSVVGMNQSDQPRRLQVKLKGLSTDLAGKKIVYYRTSEGENCHTVGHISVSGILESFARIDALVPPASIFTLSSLLA